MATTNPHDVLFKDTFGEIDKARQALRAALPSEVDALVDWSKLRRDSASFVNKELSERFADLLYSAVTRDGEPIFVYLLFEHKSSHDPWAVLQMLEYMAEIWRMYRRKEPNAPHLPPILPHLFTHVRRGTTSEQRVVFQDCFGPSLTSIPSLGAYVPHFEVVYQELADEHFAQQLDFIGQVVVWMLSNSRDIEAANDNDGFAEMCAKLYDVYQLPSGGITFRLLMKYLFRVFGPASHPVIIAMLNDLSTEMSYEASSIAEALIEQGRKEGRREGRLMLLKLAERRATSEQMKRIASIDDIEVLRNEVEVLLLGEDSPQVG